MTTYTSQQLSDLATHSDAAIKLGMCVRPHVSDALRFCAAILRAREDAKRELTPQDDAMGAWLSAAIDDPGVCAEMKRDILAWMEQYDWEAAMTAESRDGSHE
jgi:hypothetical protein